MKPKLYGDIRSRAFRCFWTLSELEVEFEPISVNLMKGEGRSEEFRKINPLGKIPVWEDEDGVLTETLAICMKIASLASKDNENKLTFKEGSHQRAQVYKWMAFAISELEQPLWNIRRHISLYPENLRANDILKSCQVEFDRAYEALCTELANNDYLVDNTFSLADIFIGQTLFWARQTKELTNDFKEVRDYTTRLKRRERFPKLA